MLLVTVTTASDAACDSYYCIFVTSLVVMLSLERSWLRMDPTEGWAQRKHGANAI